MQIKLDGRLLSAAALVLPGKAAADIGTDHNYLPVYLVANGICPYVIATDKAPQPYENAQQLVDLLSLSRQISVRRGDGLKVVEPGEAATIILAGMGGRLIMDILSGAPAVTARAERLVLQPQKNIDLLRRWLGENGWRIVAESIAFDSGFYYVIMAAEHGDMDLSDDEAEFGPCLLREGHPLFPQYLGLKLADLQTLIERLAEREGLETRCRLEQLRRQAGRIERILAARAARPGERRAEAEGGRPAIRRENQEREGS